jgi:hypothetical protein
VEPLNNKKILFKMPDFLGILTLAQLGMKLQAILWTEMVVVTVVFYVIGPRNFVLNQLRRH